MRTFIFSIHINFQLRPSTVAGIDIKLTRGSSTIPG
jgi:hypothetical protein